MEDVRDVMAIESTAQYKGVYHVLGGKISPMEGVGPQNLTIESLVEKVKTGGIKEVVVDGETGILIPLEQQDIAPFEAVYPDKFARDLASGVNKIINDETLKKTMAKNGRQRVEDTFDWRAIAKQHKELYKSLTQ